MYKKIILFVFSIIGLISLFLPYNKITVIGCTFNNGCITNYYYDPFIKYLNYFFNLNSITYFDIFEFSAVIIVVISLVFSPVLLFFNKLKASLVFIALTLLLISISIYNCYDMLGYGSYIILSHQLLLLGFSIKRYRLTNKFH